ncbi:hypothetical protein K469DRAFT_700602 [Zopfia rhizophila CBS 207.26]|uniref:Uncharacterized protein n=1 Tax=Zopfia rhizophila CBS 207.26 TaxID=1314779 RepID=A0A6A6EC37_9PEZI|nr:hypothetical protein K469DRAFT_700602 [Zopfia rhizophila CBS 207.26]
MACRFPIVSPHAVLPISRSASRYTTCHNSTAIPPLTRRSAKFEERKKKGERDSRDRDTDGFGLQV